MPVSLTKSAVKKSTFAITAAFTDENDASVTPSSISWSLYDEAGAPVNLRENQSITPAPAVTIVLSGDDLKMVDENQEREKRRLLIMATYTSSLGIGLPLKESAEFWVLNTDPGGTT